VSLWGAGGGGAVGVESGNASDAEKTESMLDSMNAPE
jgi:hypothetical protein